MMDRNQRRSSVAKHTTASVKAGCDELFASSSISSAATIYTHHNQAILVLFILFSSFYQTKTTAMRMMVMRTEHSAARNLVIPQIHRDDFVHNYIQSSIPPSCSFISSSFLSVSSPSSSSFFSSHQVTNHAFITRTQPKGLRCYGPRPVLLSGI